MRRIVLASVLLTSVVFAVSQAFAAGPSMTASVTTSPSTVPQNDPVGVAANFVYVAPDPDQPGTGATSLDDIKIDFDDDFRIRTAGMPECKPSDLNPSMTRAQANNICGPGAPSGHNARFGTGTARIATPDAPLSNLDFYNSGLDSDGNQTFFVRVTLGFSQLAYAYPGKIGNATSGTDFGRRIRFSNVDNYVYYRMNLDFDRTYQQNGDRDFLSASCSDSNLTWNYVTRAEVENAGTDLVSNSSQACRRR